MRDHSYLLLQLNHLSLLTHSRSKIGYTLLRTEIDLSADTEATGVVRAVMERQPSYFEQL